MSATKKCFTLFYFILVNIEILYLLPGTFGTKALLFPKITSETLFAENMFITSTFTHYVISDV